MRSPPIQPAQRERLEAYLAELYRWNERLNLTAVPETDAWERHIVETVDLLAVMRPAPGARVVDLGTGGGVPGVPLAVLRPDLSVTLVEADRRKAAFLTHVCGLLGVGAVRVVAQRAEELGRRTGEREGYDLAVSRAVAPPPVLCELALPLLRPGGTLWALVTDAARAASECAHAALVCGGDPPRAAAPGVLTVTKRAPTPPAYPRRPGVPLRRPLTATRRS